MVDNCYGEFVEEKEPLEVGADMIVGSLIKNPGGGLAPIGGYIAGKEGVCGKCSLPTDISGTWKRSRSFLRSHPVLLSGTCFRHRRGYGRRIKGSYFCGKYL